MGGSLNDQSSAAARLLRSTAVIADLGQQARGVWAVSDLRPSPAVLPAAPYRAVTGPALLSATVTNPTERDGHEPDVNRSLMRARESLLIPFIDTRGESMSLIRSHAP